MDYLYPSCIECCIEASKLWIDRNYGRFLEIVKKHDLKDSVKLKKREHSRIRRVNGSHKEWMLANEERQKMYRIRRSFKTHDISLIEWHACKNYFNRQCAYCGLEENQHYITRNGKKIKSDLHKEHVNDQGANDLSNCIPSCASCNSQKWVFDLSDWYNKRNKNYTEDRLIRINKWISKDYKKYIEIK